MSPEEEYIKTKEETNRLVSIYCDWLGTKKGGVWSCENMPKYAPIDYSVYKDGELKFYLEVKFRRTTAGFYESEKVPVTKYTFAYTFSKTKGIKSYFMCKWSDGVGIIDLEQVTSIDEMVARYDRGKESDLYAFYLSKDFTPLNDLYFMYIQE